MASKPSKFILLKPQLPQTKYIAALGRLLEREQAKSISGDDAIVNIKIAYLYIKICEKYRYASDRPSKEDVLTLWNHLEAAKFFLKRLSPKQFERIFPVKKTYDGDRYGEKDYFSTQEKLKAYPPNEPISERIEDFLWDYLNDDIQDFVVTQLSTISKLRQLNGQPSLAGEWAKANNIGIMFAPDVKPKSKAKLTLLA